VRGGAVKLRAAVVRKKGKPFTIEELDLEPHLWYLVVA